MTSIRWALWLGTCGAGVCIALSTGHGVAAADTDSPDSTDSSSQSTAQSSISSSEESTGQSTDTDADVDADADTDSDADADAEADSEAEADSDADADAGSSTDPTTEPRDTKGRRSADSPADTENAADSTVTEGVSSTAEVDKVADDAPVTELRTADSAAPTAVTGVQTGHAKLTIPVGPRGYTTRADWYLPTQGDGSVAATGVIWLQHGFLGNKASMSKLAQTLSQQTNSVIVVPNISSFPLACSGCWINGVPLQEAVATMFLGERASLTASASTAGFLGSLPQDFVMSGHSAGGGFASAVGGYYTTDFASDDSLRGVVMFDGFAFDGVLTSALAKLNDPFIPVYQVAAPPQPFNSGGASTKELVAARPGQFVGATLAFGSHADAIIGGNALFDFLAQLVTGRSPAGNTQAAYTLATGWINDMYQGLTPVTGNGIYGVPDQYIVMGDTAAIVLAPPPVVNLAKYLGTWYEVGSVKQFFSIGLVNTTAEYSLNLDGSIKVENSGNYFVNNGPKVTIVGSALPVDATNNKLNVRFFGAASARPPGNYWIVDLDPDYQWAVVTDPTGFSGFLLTRDPIVSADFYQELLDRASVNGVKGRITPTRQPAAAPATAISA